MTLSLSDPRIFLAIFFDFLLFMKFFRVLLKFLFPISVLPSSAEVVISELMASNATILQDEDGEFSDWIEILNTGDAAIDLAGWSLTDEVLELSLIHI